MHHIVYDPFQLQEEAENGGFLLAHYQVPLTDGDDAFCMMQKGGTYLSCDPPDSFEQVWSFESDWKPFPVPRWDPMFQPALAGRCSMCRAPVARCFRSSTCSIIRSRCSGSIRWRRPVRRHRSVQLLARPPGQARPSRRVRQPDGTIRCSDESPDGSVHPDGFEWCVHAPAVDADGNVYANAEDGFVYKIGQGGRLKTQTFLDQALGAAYTPVALDPSGRVYALNNGELTVFGR